MLERSGGKQIGIEIKASASVGEADIKGLAKFVGDRLESGLVFYSGEETHPAPPLSRRGNMHRLPAPDIPTTICPIVPYA